MEICTWRSGHGDLDVVIWMWRSRCGDLNAEIWMQRSGCGGLDVEIWMQRSGCGDLDAHMDFLPSPVFHSNPLSMQTHGPPFMPRDHGARPR